MKKISFTPRDISWLSFNARVLQEANDHNVPLPQRIRFLGIHSNNMDEFFRVRVATLRRMIALGGKKTNMHLEENPDKILDEIQTIVLSQQSEFNRIWKQMQKEMEAENVFLVNEKKLDPAQKKFVKTFYEEEVSQNIIPLMIESIPHMPFLRDKSIFLGVVMRKKESAYNQKFALIEVPSRTLGRFVKLPSPAGQQHIILLEDVIRFNLPYVFSYFGYDTFDAHIFKVTKDAEIDIDNDITTSFVQKIEKGLKNRRKGRPVRFIYDRHMDASLLAYLMKKLNLTGKDNVIPGGRIHNFRHFMDFPNVFAQKTRPQPFAHPSFKQTLRITDIILKEDVMLHFPYHNFNHIIDLLREAAFDPEVVSIKITAYRLAPASKIINALINAVRNGKQVTVMLELRARFEEEANIFLPHQFSNCANSKAHYEGTGREIWHQLKKLNLVPDAFVAGVGTGGTVMGVGNYLKEKNPKVKIHPLEPSESPTLSTGYKVGKHRIQGISDEFIPDLCELKKLDEIIAVSDGDSILMAQKLASSLGLAVGISSGANFLGALIAQNKLGAESVVATVFADSNKKYLSTDLVKEEPIKENYLSPEIELIDFETIGRL